MVKDPNSFGKLQEQLEPIIHEDKDEDEVGEDPDPEEEQA